MEPTMSSKYGIIALFECPLNEVYFIDTSLLTSNDTQRSYLDLITDAIENNEDSITIDDDMALSSGGYKKMQSALVDLPCTINSYLVVEVEVS